MQFCIYKNLYIFVKQEYIYSLNKLNIEGSLHKCYKYCKYPFNSLTETLNTSWNVPDDVIGCHLSSVLKGKHYRLEAWGWKDVAIWQLVKKIVWDFRTDVSKPCASQDISC